MNTDLYNFAYDEETATFYLVNFAGEIVGFTQYRPTGQKKNVNSRDIAKYYTYISSGRNGVFGLESLDFSDTIYLVGGIFKALTLHRLGYASLHVSSASPRWLKPQLALRGQKFLAIGDNDDEGKQFARRYGGFTSPVDVDEMSDQEIHELIKKGG